MNFFPLTPFFEILATKGIKPTLYDFKRIQRVLQSGQGWSVKRLRGVLLSLIVQDTEQERIFLRCFKDFFQEEKITEHQLSSEEVTRVLAELQSSI